MAREQQRQQAQMDLAEALSLSAPAAGQPPPQPPAPGLPPKAPPMPQRPPQGVLGGPSPLAGLGTFKSPPVAAVLQGPQGMQGHPAMTKPIGFAEGGLVVYPRGRP